MSHLPHRIGYVVLIPLILARQPRDESLHYDFWTGCPTGTMFSHRNGEFTEVIHPKRARSAGRQVLPLALNEYRFTAGPNEFQRENKIFGSEALSARSMSRS